MQTFGLFVDFDSLSKSLGDLGLPVDYDRISRGLKEMAEVFGELTIKQVHGTWINHPEQSISDGNLSLDARTVFTRHGYEFGSAGIDEIAETLDDLLIEGNCPDVVVIATGVENSTRLYRTARRLRKTQRSFVLWFVENATSSEMLNWAPQNKSVQSLLDIRAEEVALLVDLENVIFSLKDLGYQVDYTLLAQGLRKRAESGGRVLTEAHTFADFDRLPDQIGSNGRPLSAMTAFVHERFAIHHVPHSGKDTADLPMAVEGERLLQQQNSPAVFIVASGDKGFYSLVQEIKERNKIAELLGVADATSLELIELAGKEHFAYIHDFISFKRAGEAPVSSTEPESSNDTEAPTVMDENGMGPVPRLVTPLKLALILESGGLAWVPFRRLMQELVIDTTLFPSQDDAKNAINTAIANQVLNKMNIPNPRVPGTTTTALEPNREHQDVRSAIMVACRAIRLLQELQGRFPFVAFSYFNRTLLSDPTMKELRLTDQDCRDWLNYLVREGAIVVAKEDNPTNPQFKVSTLRLNPSHTLARMALQPGSTSNEEMRLRVILTMDHYLARKGTPWMPMSTLRTKLERFGRMVMEQTLADLQEEGLVITEKYDNPQKEFKTTGCFLRQECPSIEPIFRARIDVLQTLQEMLLRYSAVPGHLLEDRLSTVESLSGSEIDAHKWLEILADEGLVKLQRGSGEGTVAYVLTDTDPVILRLLNTSSDSTTKNDAAPTVPVDGDSAWLAALAEVHRHDAPMG